MTGGPTGLGADAARSVILRGGPILTVDDRAPAAEALAIRGSRILAVGSATDVKRHFTPATEILDLEGRAVLPGFVEPHVSVLETALARAGEADPVGMLRGDPARAAALCAAALRELAAHGCTTVYDPGIGRIAGAAEHELLRAAARAPDAPVRIRGAFVPELAAELHAAPGEGDDRYDVVGISLWADGALQSRAAALGEPYLDGSGAGMLNHTDETLREAIRTWLRGGWQLVLHASGDRAGEQALSCLEDALSEEEPVRFRPSRAHRSLCHRIDGFALASEEQLSRAAALGVSPSHAIDHLYFWGQNLRDRALGPGRAARLHAMLREHELELRSSCHGGSGADPLLCLRTAMTRLMRDSDDVLGPFQQLDLAQALPTVTRNPARQALLGDCAGALRAGMLADLVVLDRDPRTVAPERLHELRVLETWLGGRRQAWG